MRFAVGRLAAAALLALVAGEVSAASFKSPYQASPGLRHAAKPGDGCPAPPPAIRDLRIESVFETGKWTERVPARIAAREAATKPLHAYLALLTNMSNRAMQMPVGQREAVRACALAWMSAWAQGRALLGDVSWPEGHYERKWTLVALSEIYLQLYAGTSQAPTPSDAIASWLRAMAAPLRQRYPDNASQKQNHFYWAGLAAVSTAVVLKDQALYDWGVSRANYGFDAIDAEGFLPLELQRRKLALWYHAFSASALTQVAAFEAASGTGPSPERKQALQRLARTVFAGLADPALFERKAGEPQTEFSRGAQNSLGWIELYYRLTGDPHAEPWIRALRPFNIIWLGGDISAAFGQPLGPGPKAKSPLFAKRP